MVPNVVSIPYIHHGFSAVFDMNRIPFGQPNMNHHSIYTDHTINQSQICECLRMSVNISLNSSQMRSENHGNPQNTINLVKL